MARNDIGVTSLPDDIAVGYSKSKEITSEAEAHDEFVCDTSSVLLRKKHPPVTRPAAVASISVLIS